MKPISEDKRAGIVAAKKRNEPEREIIKWFKVSRSSISRIWRKFVETGGYAAIPYTGRKSDITAEQEAAIREEIKINSDITLEKMIEKLSLALTVSGLSRHMAKMGLTYKKRRSTQKNNSARMLSRREQSGKKTNDI